MKVLVPAALLLGLAQGKDPAGQDGQGKGTLYFFFSETSAGAPGAAVAVTTFLRGHPGEVVLRPALLVQDWSQVGKITEESPLFRSLRELRVPVQMVDEEALRLAAAWKISRLPAAVLVRDGRAHSQQGSALDLEALFRCSR